MADKYALVTGGSRGIGREIVLALVKEGWKVAASYRQDTTAMKAVQMLADEMKGQVLPIQADLHSSADRIRLVVTTMETFSTLDLLVNNAGMAPRKRQDLLEMNEDSYDEVMSTNLKGPFFLTQMIAKQMISQVQDRRSVRPMIINIGSVSAYASSLNRGEYCLSKAGLAMMTTLYADRLARHGILVYEIRPGIIDTDMTAPARVKYDRMIAEGLLPLPRWGKAEDVARAVVMLTEGALPYSTGEVINIDGGFHIRRL